MFDELRVAGHGIAETPVEQCRKGIGGDQQFWPCPGEVLHTDKNPTARFTGKAWGVENLRIAEKDARALLREKMTWIAGYAFTLLAGVARKRGDHASAVSYLEKTISAFERTDMTGLAVGARFRLGEIVGGDRGQELVATARAWMVAAGMKNPEAMVRVLLPGLDP